MKIGNYLKNKVSICKLDSFQFVYGYIKPIKAIGVQVGYYSILLSLTGWTNLNSCISCKKIQESEDFLDGLCKPCFYSFGGKKYASLA